MEAHGGEEVQLLLILNIGTRWRWVVSVTPRPRFTPGERTPGTHWIGIWVGSRAGLDAGAGGRILCPCRGSNPDRPARSQTQYCPSYSGSLCIVQLKTFFPLLISTVGSILMHWLLHCTAFCEPKELWSTSNAGTRLNPHALLYSQNVIISHPIVYKEGLGYPSYELSLRRLPLPAFVTVNKGRSYFASTVRINSI
jgi:hypothetical protein